MDMETIYRLYFRDVYLFLQGLTRSETLAEELTQETFFKALDGLKGFDGKRDVRAWLFTVARNCYYDHCRKAKHAAPLEDAETKAADTPDIAQLLVDKDAAFTVHQCLHTLEEPYKEVFSLRVFGELSFVIVRDFNSVCIKRFFDQFIKPPPGRPVFFRSHPHTQAHDHCALSKLIYKHHHSLVVFRIFIIMKDFFQDCFCFLNV